jgi:hypothetical protein
LPNSFHAQQAIDYGIYDLFLLTDVGAVVSRAWF